MIYLNNHFASMMPIEVSEMISSKQQTFNGYEIDSTESLAQECKEFRNTIAIECGFELSDFDIIFTSGIEESNCYIIAAAVRSYAAKTKKMPHVIISNIENSSLIDYCLTLESDSLCQTTVISIETDCTSKYYGMITEENLRKCVRPNTCIISISASSKELSTLIMIKKLAIIAHEQNIPFHSDADHLFSCSYVRPLLLNIDAVSIAFNKMGGPVGIGTLIVRKILVSGYELRPFIARDREKYLNYSLLCGSHCAMKLMINYPNKIKYLTDLRQTLIRKLSKKIICKSIRDYEITNPHVLTVRTVYIVGNSNEVVSIPNVMILAVGGGMIRSHDIVSKLRQKNIIVNGLNIDYYDLPAELKYSAILVSFYLYNTYNDIIKFVNHYAKIIVNK